MLLPLKLGCRDLEQKDFRDTVLAVPALPGTMTEVPDDKVLRVCDMMWSVFLEIFRDPSEPSTPAGWPDIIGCVFVNNAWSAF